MTASSPHLVTLLVTIGVGLVMCRMGFRERRLLARRDRGKLRLLRPPARRRPPLRRCG